MLSALCQAVKGKVLKRRNSYLGSLLQRSYLNNKSCLQWALDMVEYCHLKENPYLKFFVGQNCIKKEICNFILFLRKLSRF